jgi:hypothetical protein
MVAARHQDQSLLAEHYNDIASLVLTIDGLQPEKGHETLYVVRELRGKRVWFAEALLSSSAEEVQRLIAKAKDWAQQLGKPVELWMSDKQDAFVKGIALEFPDTPHRYCQNHFLRDLAKPVLEQDSHQKVKMRKKVRGLRDIEKQVLEDRRKAQEEADPVKRDNAAAATVTPASDVGSGPECVVADTATARQAGTGTPGGCEPAEAVKAASAEATKGEAGQVVLDYCASVRGILNDDQGGPLHPPGIRMAEALQEVSESLQRNLEAKKGGGARSSWPNSRAASTGECKQSPRSKSGSKSTSKR